MPSEDFTTYIVVDPNGNLAIAPTRITLNSINKQVCAYVYKPLAVSGDFEHKVRASISSENLERAGWGFWSLWNGVGCGYQLGPAGVSGISASLYASRYGGPPVCIIYEDYAGVEYEIRTTVPMAFDTLYYFTIRRTGATFSVTISLDGITPMETISLPLHAVTDYQYLYAFSNWGGPLDVNTSGYSEYLEVPGVVPACESYMTQTECEVAGCYWYNNSCHASAPTCESILTQAECEIRGCYWYNGACHSTPPPPPPPSGTLPLLLLGAGLLFMAMVWKKK